jgi:hypothetical protein
MNWHRSRDRHRNTPERREYLRAYRAAYRQRLRALGLCRDCKEPVRPGSTRCDWCLQLARTR